MKTSCHAPASRRLRFPEVLGRLTAASVLLVALATRVFAAPAESNFDRLADVLQQRIQQIRAIPKPTGQELFEARQLKAAIKDLHHYHGSLVSYAALKSDKQFKAAGKDVDVLVSVAQHVAASQTTDESVLGATGLIRDTLDDFGQEAVQFAQAGKVQIFDAGTKTSIDQLLAAGDMARNEGLRTWAFDIGQGADLLGDAYASAHDAHVLSLKEKRAEAAANPVNLDPVDAVPETTDPLSDEPFMVHTTVALDNPAPQVTGAVRALLNTSFDPTPMAAADAPMPPPTQATIGTTTLLDVPAGPLDVPIEVAVKPFADESGLTLWGDPGTSAMAGGACDVQGDTMVVGSTPPQGVSGPHWVSVRSRNQGGFGAWGEVARLYNHGLPTVSVDTSDFGSAVAVAHDTIVVGAPGDGSSGTALVFERKAGNAWVLTATLTPTLGTVPGDTADARFGASVSVSKAGTDRIVVGAPETKWKNS